MDNKIHRRIKEVRTERKLTQAQFGDLVGVARSTITNIENGVMQPSRRLLKNIAYVNHINPLWLTDGEQPKYMDPDQEPGAIQGFSSTPEMIKTEYNLTDLEYNLVRTYLELSTRERRTIAKYLVQLSDGLYFKPGED